MLHCCNAYLFIHELDCPNEFAKKKKKKPFCLSRHCWGKSDKSLPKTISHINWGQYESPWVKQFNHRTGIKMLIIFPFWCHFQVLVLNFDCRNLSFTVYPKKYAHGFCFAVLCCGYTLTDFLISIRLTPLALWQSNDCPSASKATLMNMDKYFMWIHYERLHNHNKAKHNKTVCIFLGIYCT